MSYRLKQLISAPANTTVAMRVAPEANLYNEYQVHFLGVWEWDGNIGGRLAQPLVKVDAVFPTLFIGGEPRPASDNELFVGIRIDGNYYKPDGDSSLEVIEAEKLIHPNANRF